VVLHQLYYSPKAENQIFIIHPSFIRQLPDDISPEFQGRVYRTPRHPESFRDRGILFIKTQKIITASVRDGSFNIIPVLHLTPWILKKIRILSNRTTIYDNILLVLLITSIDKKLS